MFHEFEQVLPRFQSYFNNAESSVFKMIFDSPYSHELNSEECSIQCTNISPYCYIDTPLIYHIYILIVVGLGLVM